MADHARVEWAAAHHQKDGPIPCGSPRPVTAVTISLSLPPSHLPCTRWTNRLGRPPCGEGGERGVRCDAQGADRPTSNRS